VGRCERGSGVRYGATSGEFVRTVATSVEFVGSGTGQRREDARHRADLSSGTKYYSVPRVIYRKDIYIYIYIYIPAERAPAAIGIWEFWVTTNQPTPDTHVHQEQRSSTHTSRCVDT